MNEYLMGFSGEVEPEVSEDGMEEKMPVVFDLERFLKDVKDASPGPWFHPAWGEAISIDSPDYKGIATINPTGNWNAGIPSKLDKANARLIAAAPRLLALARQQAAEIERLRGALDPLAGTINLDIEGLNPDDIVFVDAQRGLHGGSRVIRVKHILAARAALNESEGA